MVCACYVLYWNGKVRRSVCTVSLWCVCGVCVCVCVCACVRARVSFFLMFNCPRTHRLQMQHERMQHEHKLFHVNLMYFKDQTNFNKTIRILSCRVFEPVQNLQHNVALYFSYYWNCHQCDSIFECFNIIWVTLSPGSSLATNIMHFRYLIFKKIKWFYST